MPKCIMHITTTNIVLIVMNYICKELEMICFTNMNMLISHMILKNVKKKTETQLKYVINQGVNLRILHVQK